jgi:hypothetical protein
MKKPQHLVHHQQRLYSQIQDYHFERYGCFGNQFPAWDYFGRINEEGWRILSLIKKRVSRP